MFYSVWQVEKKKLYRSPKHSDSLYINQTLLFNFFIQNTIYISVTTLFMHLLNIFLFPAICFKLPILELFSIFLEGSSYRESTVLCIYETWSLPVIHAYSYFEKSCRKKCTPQSRKALWVVLSSLFFKEILKELVRKAVEMCLRVLKESNKSRFDRYSRQKQYWSYPILISFGYRVQIFPTTVLEIAVYIHTYKHTF